MNAKMIADARDDKKGQPQNVCKSRFLIELYVKYILYG